MGSNTFCPNSSSTCQILQSHQVTGHQDLNLPSWCSSVRREHSLLAVSQGHPAPTQDPQSQVGALLSPWGGGGQECTPAAACSWPGLLPLDPAPHTPLPPGTSRPSPSLPTAAKGLFAPSIWVYCGVQKEGLQAFTWHPL